MPRGFTHIHHIPVRKHFTLKLEHVEPASISSLCWVMLYGLKWRLFPKTLFPPWCCPSYYAMLLAVYTRYLGLVLFSSWHWYSSGKSLDEESMTLNTGLLPSLLSLMQFVSIHFQGSAPMPTPSWGRSVAPSLPAPTEPDGCIHCFLPTSLSYSGFSR